MILWECRGGNEGATHTGKMNRKTGGSEIQWQTCGKYKISIFIGALLCDSVHLTYHTTGRGFLKSSRPIICKYFSLATGSRFHRFSDSSYRYV